MLAFSLLLTTLLAPPPAVAPSVAVSKGPPWVSIELPANPYDRASRNAYLLVHAFHHQTPMPFPVTGRAEGIVNGVRKSVTLKFEPTDRTGVYVLTNQWGESGEWTLMISVSQGPSDAATALVQISEGQVFSIGVPTRREGGYTLPRAVTLADVEATLQNRSSRVAVNR